MFKPSLLLGGAINFMIHFIACCRTDDSD